MPKNFVQAGQTAITNLKTQIPDLAALTRLIKAKNPSANVQSCAMTASVVADAVSTNQPVPISGIATKTPDKRVALVEDLLKQPRMVYIGLSPDHHFNLVTIDKDKLVILQGFQGVYSLMDWMMHRGGGVIRKDEFLAAMRDLVGSDEARKQAAAIKLFSYRLAYEGKAATGNAKTVEDEIHAYYDNKVVRLSNISYVEL